MGINNWLGKSLVKSAKSVTVGKVCPVCKSADLSPDWSGIILIFEPGKIYGGRPHSI